MRYIPIRAVTLHEHVPRRPALYHTTTAGGALEILEDRELRGGHGSGFVSVSEIPFTAPGETSGNQVIIVFARAALADHFEKVEYDEDWFSQHQEMGEYIAGEGWMEWVHEYLEECDEDDFGIDEDCEEAAYYEGALNSFMYKSDEAEWIGEAPFRFPADAVRALLVVDDRVIVDELRSEASLLGYDVPVLEL